MKGSMNRGAWLLVAATLAAVPAIAVTPAITTAQASTPVIAVLYFSNNSIGKDRADYDGLGKGMADLLITDLASNQRVRVVERERIQSLLQEQNLIKQGSIDPQTAVRLGKLLGVQYMIDGSFMNVRGQVVLTARAINVETGKITNPQKVQASGEDVLGPIAELSKKLNNDMDLPSLVAAPGSAAPAPPADGMGNGAQQAGEQASDAKPTKLDVRSAILYSKALEAQDAGNRDRAAELYRAVLTRFPDFTPAQKHYDRVTKSGD